MGLSSLQLDAFLAVVRAGNVSKAARAVGLTQSALSQRLLNLEEELGQTLLVRGRKGVAATAVGERLLELCRAREGLEAEFLGALSGTGVGLGGALSKKGIGLSGTLRVAGYSTVTRSLLMPALSGLVRENPAVRIEVSSREVRDLPTVLRSGEADLVVLDRELNRPGVEARVLGEEVNVLVEANEGRPLPDVYLDHDAEDRTTDEFFRRQGKKGVPDGRRYFVDEIYGILDGVALGWGRAVVPRHLALGDSRVRVVSGYRELRVPVVLHYAKLRVFPRLQVVAIETLCREVGRLLRA